MRWESQSFLLADEVLLSDLSAALAPFAVNRELATAKHPQCTMLKLIHGDICIAVQKRLRALDDQGAIRGCIFGVPLTRKPGTC
jgi:hypothetical protein